MQKKMTCFLCHTDKNLLQYDDEDGICRPCHDEQMKQAAYYKSLRVQMFPEIDKITDNIYLGNEDAARTQALLKQRQITAICACGSLLQTPFVGNPLYEYKIYQIADFPKQNIIQFFDDHYEWMEKMLAQNRKILIHCAAGISRSASFTIAFLMKKMKLSFEQTLQFVRKGRKYANPNSGFRSQLANYQQRLLKGNQK